MYFCIEYYIFNAVLALTTQSLTSSHRHVLVDSDFTLSYTVARVAEMSCVLSMGNGQTILWNQASPFVNSIVSTLYSTVVNDIVRVYVFSRRFMFLMTVQRKSSRSLSCTSFLAST